MKDIPLGSAETYIVEMLTTEGTSLDIDALAAHVPSSIGFYDLQAAVWALKERGLVVFTTALHIRLTQDSSLDDRAKLERLKMLVTQHLAQAEKHEHLPNSSLGVQAYFSGQIAILRWIKQVMKEFSHE